MSVRMWMSWGIFSLLSMLSRKSVVPEVSLRLEEWLRIICLTSGDMESQGGVWRCDWA